MKMTEALKKELNTYFSNVEDLLLCDRKNKKVFLEDLKNDIDEFVQHEPEADFGSILSAFGTPAEIAESFLKNADIADIKKKMNIKKIVLFSLLAVVLVYVIFVVASFIDVHTEAHGYYEEGILQAGLLLTGGIGI